MPEKKRLFAGDSESDDEDYATLDHEQEDQQSSSKGENGDSISLERSDEFGLEEDVDTPSRELLTHNNNNKQDHSFEAQKRLLRKQLKKQWTPAQLAKLRATFPTELHQKGGEAPIPQPVAQMPPEGAAWVHKESRRLLVGRFAMAKVEEQQHAEELEHLAVEQQLHPYFQHVAHQRHPDRSHSPLSAAAPTEAAAASPSKSKKRLLVAQSLGLPVGDHFVDQMQEKSREAGWTCAVVQQSSHTSIADSCAKQSLTKSYLKKKDQKEMMRSSRLQHHHQHQCAVLTKSESPIGQNCHEPEPHTEDDVRRGLMLLNDDMLKAEATQMLEEVLRQSSSPTSVVRLPHLLSRSSPSPSFRAPAGSRDVLLSTHTSVPRDGRHSPLLDRACGSPTMSFSPVHRSPTSKGLLKHTNSSKLAPLDGTISSFSQGGLTSVSFNHSMATNGSPAAVSSPKQNSSREDAILKGTLSVLGHPSVSPLLSSPSKRGGM